MNERTNPLRVHYLGSRSRQRSECAHCYSSDIYMACVLSARARSLLRHILGLAVAPPTSNGTIESDAIVRIIGKRADGRAGLAATAAFHYFPICSFIHFSPSPPLPSLPACQRQIPFFPSFPPRFCGGKQEQRVGNSERLRLRPAQNRDILSPWPKFIRAATTIAAACVRTNAKEKRMLY